MPKTGFRKKFPSAAGNQTGRIAQHLALHTDS